MTKRNSYYESVGVAIIGMGYMGLHHFKVLKQLERLAFGAKVVGCCDVNPDRLKNLSAWDLGYATTNVEDLLSRDDVTAVYVTTPWHNHADLIEKVTTAGKHIYGEKPIGRDFRQVNELSELIRASGVQAQAGLLLRHQPSLWKIKTLVDSGDLGPLIFASLREDSSFPRPGGVFQTELKDRLAGRGILWEENIHDLDLLLHLFGTLKIESAHLTGSRHRQ